MRLTNEQAWEAAKKFPARSGKYLDLPGLGLFTPDEVKEGIKDGFLVFSFLEGRVYVGLSAEEIVEYRQVGRRKLATSTLDPEKSVRWLSAIHPSVNQEDAWFKETKITTEDFEKWLGALAEETPRQSTPLKKILEQKKKSLT